MDLPVAAWKRRKRMARHAGHLHLARYREIAEVLAEEGLGALAVSLSLPEALRSRHEPSATTPERLRRALERLGPGAVKIGQLLSTRPDLVPDEYRVELKRLQDDVSPLPFEAIEGVIRESFGAPADEVFATFEHTPIASASIGQVHAARLKSGEDVVVKVQRPSILALVETDLDIMRMQARRLSESGLLPSYIDAIGLAEEFAHAVRQELDYVAEASNIERFRTAMEHNETVTIPRVFHEYSNRRVLTLERLYGIPFNRLDLIDEAKLDRHGLAERGIRAYLSQIFELGVYHADPHPGNLFALPGDRIGFTDFGRVGRVLPGIGDVASDLLLGVVDRDADLAADALWQATVDPGMVDFEQLRLRLSVLIGKYYGVALGEFRVGEVLQDLLDLTREHRLRLPSELVMLLATMALLEGVGRDLDPSFDFIAVARPYAAGVARRDAAPDELTRKLVRTARRWLRTFTGLPSSVDRALRRIAEGELRIAVRPEGYERFLDRAEELADRLAFAVLIASFVIGFSTLLTVEWLARWIQVVLLLGMVAAVVVSAWMFASLLLARLRGRRSSG